MVGGLANSEARLRAGLNLLEAHRDGTGRWKRFPFYYTLLALEELDFRSAVKEKKYAAPVLERMLKRKTKIDKFNIRKKILAERILESF